ncbi:SigE family RNA polymerase sigma factor [Nocardioides sp.]|uniref:SigE family RNA polymerase sigma factor n=1 Tax=Nocardioides sp. TaxID=35761 RepID=UPI002BDDA7F7|nr:SigE family RNA polymerase sigma factor [Nocardioides sp.]HXH78095.1 SigE family RNA polymerase sigma factor [Nocardioides sp.]
MIAAAPSQEESDDFETWVAARGPALTRYAYLVCGDVSESQDLVQAALEKAWPRWRSISRQGDPEAYLRRAITNGAISRWRKLRRLRVVSQPPLEAVHESPDSDVAWQLCAELPARQRAAVVLRFYEDLTYADIGKVLGCPEATARSHVHRALTTLRGRLSPGDVR